MTAGTLKGMTTATLAITLTAGVLVAATGPAATAGSGSTDYTCDFGTLGAHPVPVSTTVPDLTGLPAGAPVPAGSLNPSFVFDTASFAGVLALVTSPSTTGMALGVGDQAVPLHGFAFGSPSGASLPASATSGGFTAPDTPGEYDVTSPESFTFTGLLPGIPAPTPVSALCVTDAPAVLGSLTVLPGEEPAIVPSTTEATVVKKRIFTGKRAKVKVTTVAGTDPLTMPATGEVVVRKGKRVIGSKVLEDGATTIRTKRFKKPGRYRLTVRYLGDALTEPSKDKVRVRVVRRRR